MVVRNFLRDGLDKELDVLGKCKWERGDALPSILGKHFHLAFIYILLRWPGGFFSPQCTNEEFLSVC
jgi:hypothetical protein